MKWHEVVPVALSIVILILVAVLEKQSKLVAAITATMPLTIVLGLWVVYASAGGDTEAMESFTSGLIIGIIPSVIFLIAVWFGVRQGLRLLPLIAAGYAAWGACLVVILGVRKLIGL